MYKHAYQLVTAENGNKLVISTLFLLNPQDRRLHVEIKQDKCQISALMAMRGSSKFYPGGPTAHTRQQLQSGPSTRMVERSLPSSDKGQQSHSRCQAALQHNATVSILSCQTYIHACMNNIDQQLYVIELIEPKQFQLPWISCTARERSRRTAMMVIVQRMEAIGARVRVRGC